MRAPIAKSGKSRASVDGIECSAIQPDPDDDLQQPDERHFELWQSKTGMHMRGLEEDRK
jgi:hypothetical protein